ncbi:MAG TPA: metalloregulator ArsR/SmtB family transcription factor [Verrucomicrobiae bacterium]|nr:metalloregulator ArsR/SmtB family transcription factor [Verrucomicrobiae bacterium]
MTKPDRLFKAFADETRLRILNLVAQRERCVCEFQKILRVPQPKISRHLAYLRRSGLLVARREGRWIHYSLAKPESAVHTALVGCIRSCFRDVDLLKRDLIRDGRCCKP